MVFILFCLFCLLVFRERERVCVCVGVGGFGGGGAHALTLCFFKLFTINHHLLVVHVSVISDVSNTAFSIFFIHLLSCFYLLFCFFLFFF